MRASAIGADDVANAVLAATARRAAAVDRVPGSVANQDFVVTLEDQIRLLVKIGPPAELAAEAWACRHLRRIGAPVPAVVAFDLAGVGPGLSMLIVDFVSGQPCSEPEVAGQVGEAIRRIHQVQLPGWGPLVVVEPMSPTSHVHGRYRSWQAAIQAGVAGAWRLVDAGVISDAVASACLGQILTDGLTRYRGPGVLLHNDLKTPHIFATARDPRRLTAIIDWGDVSVGDPELDIARASMVGPQFLSWFLDGYGLQPSRELGVRLARYRIWWNLRALIYEHDAGGDWFDAYRGRMRDDLAVLAES